MEFYYPQAFKHKANITVVFLLEIQLQLQDWSSRKIVFYFFLCQLSIYEHAIASKI